LINLPVFGISPLNRSLPEGSNPPSTDHCRRGVIPPKQITAGGEQLQMLANGSNLIRENMD